MTNMPREEVARRILLNWEPYRSMSPYELGMRIDVPLHLGFAALLDPGIFFSWSRLEQDTGAFNRMALGHPPLFCDWSDDGPVLWLMDVAARPGVSSFQVARAINRFMVDRNKVMPGERAAFRRHCGARFGWAAAQEVA